MSHQILYQLVYVIMTYYDDATTGTSLIFFSFGVIIINFSEGTNSIWLPKIKASLTLPCSKYTGVVNESDVITHNSISLIHSDGNVEYFFQNNMAINYFFYRALIFEKFSNISHRLYQRDSVMKLITKHP